MGASPESPTDSTSPIPGYNETLTGRGDPRINTNAYPPNPNVTVFEWLNRQPGLQGRVAAFGTWDAFPRIFNRERAGIHLWAGWEQPFPAAKDSAARLLNELTSTTTRIWDDLSYDAFMQFVVRDYIAREHPRLLFVGFGETDVWAHDGKYDKLLRSAQQDDAFIAELWSMMQAMPQYRGKTTFIITTDHGRGDGANGWRDHGKDVPGADRIWIAVLGPGIAAAWCPNRHGDSDPGPGCRDHCRPAGRRLHRRLPGGRAVDAGPPQEAVADSRGERA